MIYFQNFKEIERVLDNPAPLVQSIKLGIRSIPTIYFFGSKFVWLVALFTDGR